MASTLQRHASLSPSHASVSTEDDDGDSVFSDAAGVSSAAAGAGGVASTSSFFANLGASTGGGGREGPSTTAGAAGRPPPAAAELKPSGPICTFGPRLAYTYFPQPAPREETLNALTSSAAGGEGGGADGGGGGVLWFTVDDQLQYLSFFQDYGPLNIACLYRFCLHLHNLLTSPENLTKRVFLYSSDEPDKKVNAALLMALYAMVVMRWPVADVLHPLSALELQPYRDAGYSRADYHLHPQHIIYGLSRAISLNLLDLSSFNLTAYESAEKVETGDWNWITVDANRSPGGPGGDGSGRQAGFLAFASPVEAGYSASGGGGGMGKGGKISRAFRNVLEEFEGKGVKVVVRLNKKLYSPTHFTDRGIEHVEMYFDDGTNPTMEIVREFIDLSERVLEGGGAVAVHCKAGLGRTGTLIGAYLIYKHGFTADEAIGFMRLMRPGSCVGPQQHFLYENQLEWVRWAARDQLRTELAAQGALPTATTASASSAPQQEGLPRPITPPNEADLAESRSPSRSRVAAAAHPPTTPSGPSYAPTTPKRQPNVPGQPRKTPGRSRHGVAAPEEVSPGENGTAAAAGEAEREEERMEGVVLTSPKKGGNSGKGKGVMLDGEAGEDEEEEEEDELAMAPLPSIAASPQKLLGLAPPASISSATGAAASTRPKTPTTSTSTSTRPTRIARPAQQRPLSALADNRIVDRLGTTRASTRAGTGGARSAAAAAAAGGGAGGLARSRAAKNLNTVFEATAAAGGAGGGQTRYPLRNGRTLSAGSNSPSASSAAAVAAEAPASPTKLPQRVLGKRAGAGKAAGAGASAGGAPGGGGGGGGGGFDPALAAAQSGVGAKGVAGGRNVRRRRSSMGSAEFTQAG